jgi:hypothetical protein
MKQTRIILLVVFVVALLTGFILFFVFRRPKLFVLVDPTRSKALVASWTESSHHPIEFTDIKKGDVFTLKKFKSTYKHTVPGEMYYMVLNNSNLVLEYIEDVNLIGWFSHAPHVKVILIKYRDKWVLSAENNVSQIFTTTLSSNALLLKSVAEAEDIFHLWDLDNVRNH